MASTLIPQIGRAVSAGWLDRGLDRRGDVWRALPTTLSSGNAAVRIHVDVILVWNLVFAAEMVQFMTKILFKTNAHILLFSTGVSHSPIVTENNVTHYPRLDIGSWLHALYIGVVRILSGGALFCPKKSWRPFLVVALTQDHLNIPPNISHPAKTVLKISFKNWLGVHFVSWGCTYTFFL